jgi:hypothetical protein
MRDFTLGFWVPALLGAAFLIFSLAVPSLGISLPSWAPGASLIAAVCLIGVAAYSAFRAKTTVGDGGAAELQAYQVIIAVLWAAQAGVAVSAREVAAVTPRSSARTHPPSEARVVMQRSSAPPTK